MNRARSVYDWWDDVSELPRQRIFRSIERCEDRANLCLTKSSARPYCADEWHINQCFKVERNGILNHGNNPDRFPESGLKRFSMCGSMIAVDTTGGVVVYSTRTGEELYATPHDPDFEFTDIVWTLPRQGCLLLVGRWEIRAWRLGTSNGPPGVPTPIALHIENENMSYSIHSVKHHHDEALFAVATFNENGIYKAFVFAGDLPNFTLIDEMHIQPAEVDEEAEEDMDNPSVAWSPVGISLLWFTGYETVVAYYRKVQNYHSPMINVATMSLIRPHGVATSPVAVEWSPDGTRVAAVYDDPTIVIWDARTRAPVQTLFDGGRSVRRVAWKPDGTQLATFARIVNAVDEDEDEEGAGNEVEPVQAAGWPTIDIWSLESEEKVESFDGETLNELRWTPDGRSIIVNEEVNEGETERKIIIDLANGDRRRINDEHIEISSDRTKAAFAQNDHVRIVDAASL